MKLLNCLSILTITALTSFKATENAPTVKDYFAIPGPIEFNKTGYHLSWSAHPSANYFKQEYLPANEKSETFTRMMMVEVVVGEIALPDAVKAKINELEQRKKTDPLANYQVIKNAATGEYMLDFMMSQSSGGKTAVAEWNVYRYLRLTDKSDKNGIMLFALSRRAYGNAVPNFLKLMKTARLNDINRLAAYKIPSIKITAG